MNRIVQLSALGALLLPNPFALMAQPTSSAVDRNLTTPEPVTPVWKTERDLIVLFENADDRVAFAIQIMNVSLNTGNNLSPQQRVDGLSIAGHTHWKEAKFDDTITCFDGIVAINVSNDSTADALRMKGQAHFFKGEYQPATDAYLLCYNMSRQMNAIGEYNGLSNLVVTMLIDSARKSGNTDVAIQITNNVLADPTLRESARTYSLWKGAQASLAGDNNERAIVYLTTLLEDYPQFGLDMVGERVVVEMDLIKARGLDFEKFEPQAIDAMAKIVQNPQYYGLPTWTSPVEKMATLLEKTDETTEANALRLWAVDQIDIRMNGLDPADHDTPMYLDFGKSAQFALLKNAASSYAKRRLYQEQANVLGRMSADFADIRPQEIELVNTQLNSLVQRGYHPE